MTSDTPLNYIERIEDYYQKLGYGEPYRWAHFDEVPFQALKQPLSESMIGIVTTAAPYRADKGEQGPGAVYNGAAKFFSVYSAVTVPEPDLRISHIAYDRIHTTAEDQGAYFPLRALQKLHKSGKFGALSPRFYGLPTNRSHKSTIEVDCNDLLRLCTQDRVNVVILVPNCPVCHQSVSLAARVLETAGIATVIMGCAKDIVEHVGVPRLLFNNFPLGNSAGLPHDSESQIAIAGLALDLLENASGPRTTVQSSFRWKGADNWQLDYSNAALLTEDEILRRRKEFDRGKAEAKKARHAVPE